MIARRVRRIAQALAAPAFAAILLAGCQDVSDFAGARHMSPVSASLKQEISAQNMDVRSPILLRIFKEESALEVWKQDRSGKMQLLREYKICAWSGVLGPKLKEGDRQAPEGFYTVTPGLMNPKSSYYLAFNIGFPNSFDRSHQRTGSNIMVHGDCSSRGCYSMTDEQIEEIYVLAREAFAGGQRGFQVQAFPFRMTAENMAKHADSEHVEFWAMLKEGSDHFEVTRKVPQVDICGRRYVFNATPDAGAFRADASCPAFTVDQGVEQLVAAKRDADTARTDTIVLAMQAKEERDKRWAEREKAFASLFSGGKRSSADAAAPGDAAPVAVAGTVPTPKPAPTERDRGAPEPVVASVAAPAGPAAPAAVATIAALRAPEKVAASGSSPAASEVSALGYAAEAMPDDTDAGFFDAVTRSSQGLFRRAGSLLD